MNDPYVEEPVSSISRKETDVEIRNLKFSNHNGGNFIIGKHEHKILPIFSRKYTLDQATVRSSPDLESANNYGKFSDNVSQDNDITLTPLPRRGILKNQTSEPPIQTVHEEPKIQRHSNSDGNFSSRIKYRIHFPKSRPNVSILIKKVA